MKCAKVGKHDNISPFPNRFGSCKKKVQITKVNRRGGVSPPLLAHCGSGDPTPTKFLLHDFLT